MTTYMRGSVVRTTAVFRKNDGTDDLVDPESVVLYVKKPGDVSQHSYPASPSEIINDSAGAYHADLVLNIGGEWHVRWESGGDWQAAEELTFDVDGGAFV